MAVVFIYVASRAAGHEPRATPVLGGNDLLPGMHGVRRFSDLLFLFFNRISIGIVKLVIDLIKLSKQLFIFCFFLQRKIDTIEGAS